jgi:hypothetical protein
MSQESWEYYYTWECCDKEIETDFACDNCGDWYCCDFAYGSEVDTCDLCGRKNPSSEPEEDKEEKEEKKENDNEPYFIFFCGCSHNKSRFLGCTKTFEEACEYMKNEWNVDWNEPAPEKNGMCSFQKTVIPACSRHSVDFAIIRQDDMDQDKVVDVLENEYYVYIN